MPTRNRSLTIHQRWSETERWGYSAAVVLGIVAFRHFAFPANWSFTFLPFAICVPLVYFFFGRGPGIVSLPLTGLIALLMGPGFGPHPLQALLAFLLYLAYGTPICWMIDRLQSALRVLAESERLRNAVLDAQSDWVMRFDVTGRFIYLNSAACAVFGLAADEAIGKSWKMIVAEADWPIVEARLELITPTNPTNTGENRLVNARGDVVWGEFINTGIFDAEGHRIGIQSVGHDISDRKRLESRFEHAMHELEDLYQNAPCAYYSLDKDGYFTKVNGRLCEWLGQPAEALVGKRRLLEFYTPESAEIFRKQYPAFKERGSIRDHEIQLVDGEGRVRTVLVDSNVVYDGPGEFLYSRAVMTDITERKAAEAEVRRLNAELAKRVAGT